MIFKVEKTYRSKLDNQQIIERLHLITEKYYTNSSEKFKFEGEIKINSFIILPIFNYGPNAQMRPEIIGLLKENDKSTEISLKFHLPKGLKILLIFALILNLGVLIMIISTSILISFPILDKWWLFLIFLIVTFFIFHTYFLFKVNKSEEILMSLFKMK
jgi:hypothetical protein